MARILSAAVSVLRAGQSIAVVVCYMCSASDSQSGVWRTAVFVNFSQLLCVVEIVVWNTTHLKCPGCFPDPKREIFLL